MSAFCLVPAVMLVLVSPSVHMASKVVALASLGVMLGIIGIFIITRTQQKYLLLLQSGYFAVFFAAILFTAYSGF